MRLLYKFPFCRLKKSQIIALYHPAISNWQNWYSFYFSDSKLGSVTYCTMDNIYLTFLRVKEHSGLFLIEELPLRDTYPASLSFP
jgi:hypothetical protein